MNNLQTIARSYLNVPFRLDGRNKNVGVDCIGLIICVTRDLGIEIPDLLDFRLLSEEKRFQSCIESLGWKTELPSDDLAGKIVCFSIGMVQFSRHSGIMVSNNSFIHASDKYGMVIESPLIPLWKKRIKTVIAFPAI